MSNIVDNTNNPWAGLSSYQDPETTDVQLKFCGRDHESFDVANLIDNNIFVTLYGRSGTGKTSLINAGVFPRLRRQGYLPISIRLGMDAIGLSLQQCIISKIVQGLRDKGEIHRIEVVDMPQDEQAAEYLWSFFARTRFVDLKGKTIFPVIVLDQFEEVFRNRRDDAEALLRQIYFMMDESHELTARTINGVQYSYDFNFRFVVSIREDELYRLEDSIDNNYLPNMKLCRFRLRNLSEEGARDAILTPGEGLLKDNEKERIANTIMDIARNKEDRSISANILSLICSRLFVEYQRAGAPYISLSLVDKFVKGNPFVKFYNEATKGFSDREKSYIETNLVDSSNRRNSIPESDFLLHVKKGKLLFEGDRRILQRISTSADDNYRVELIHDSFCDPLNGLKEKREKRKRLKMFAYTMAFVLMSVVIGLYLIGKNRELNEANSQLVDLNNALINEKDNTTKVNEKLKKLISAVEIANDSISKTNEQLSKSENELKKKNNELILMNHQLEEQKVQTKKVTHERDSLIDANKMLTSLDNTIGTQETSIDGKYVIDGIVFSSNSLSDEQLVEWRKAYTSICKDEISGKTDGYKISEDMMEDDPCLVYLLLKSKSIGTKAEKQEWFDLYSLMDQKQINKLYDILYRESYKLADIEAKYAKKQEEIENKYREIEKTPD